MKTLTYIIGIFVLILFMGACSSNDDSILSDSNSIYKEPLLLVDKKGIFHSPFYFNDSTLHFMLGKDFDISTVKVLIKHEQDSLIIADSVKFTNGIVDFSDFTKTVLFKSHKYNKIKKVIVYDLPVIIIETPQYVPIDSKTDRIEGCKVSIIDTENEFYNIGSAGIRGRGQSSWLQPKKPYNIRLDKKKEILGMNPSKHWVLLANAYYDRTQLHNTTAFEIARLTDYPWVQSGEFVELILNGSHQGLYYLCEKIRAEKDKIELCSSSNGISPEECGYLLESFIVLESNDSTTEYPYNYFNTGIIDKTGSSRARCIMGWEIKEPDENLQSEHIDFIRSQMIEVEKLIKDSIESGKYRDFFDIETAINWYLVEELCLNEESCRSKNLYLYKNGKGKFCIGPPWDFDWSTFGEIGVEPHERKPVYQDWTVKTALYYEYLFKDSVFVERLKEKWNCYKERWKTEIPIFIDVNYSKIKRAAKRNEMIWPSWARENKYPNVLYDDYVAEMKDAFLRQLEIMDGRINKND